MSVSDRYVSADKELFMCPECNNRYSTDRKPTFLFCGHKVCSQCLDFISRCPKDDKPIENKAACFVDNDILMQLEGMCLRSARSQSVSDWTTSAACASCNSYDQTLMVCKHCSNMFCSKDYLTHVLEMLNSTSDRIENNLKVIELSAEVSNEHYLKQHEKIIDYFEKAKSACLDAIEKESELLSNLIESTKEYFDNVKAKLTNIRGIDSDDEISINFLDEVSSIFAQSDAFDLNASPSFISRLKSGNLVLSSFEDRELRHNKILKLTENSSVKVAPKPDYINVKKLHPPGSKITTSLTAVTSTLSRRRNTMQTVAPNKHSTNSNNLRVPEKGRRSYVNLADLGSDEDNSKGYRSGSESLKAPRRNNSLKRIF